MHIIKNTNSTKSYKLNKKDFLFHRDNWYFLPQVRNDMQLANVPAMQLANVPAMVWEQVDCVLQEASYVEM